MIQCFCIQRERESEERFCLMERNAHFLTFTQPEWQEIMFNVVSPWWWLLSGQWEHMPVQACVTKLRKTAVLGNKTNGETRWKIAEPVWERRGGGMMPWFNTAIFPFNAGQMEPSGMLRAWIVNIQTHQCSHNESNDKSSYHKNPQSGLTVTHKYASLCIMCINTGLWAYDKIQWVLQNMYHNKHYNYRATTSIQS